MKVLRLVVSRKSIKCNWSFTRRLLRAEKWVYEEEKPFTVVLALTIYYITYRSAAFRVLWLQAAERRDRDEKRRTQ